MGTYFLSIAEDAPRLDSRVEEDLLICPGQDVHITGSGNSPVTEEQWGQVNTLVL
jgi:hypothetical protein